MGYGANFKKGLAEAKAEKIDVSGFNGSDAFAASVEALEKALTGLTNATPKIKTMLSDVSKIDANALQAFKKGVEAVNAEWTKAEKKLNDYGKVMRAMMGKDKLAAKSKGLNVASGALGQIEGFLGKHSLIGAKPDDLVKKWSDKAIAKAKAANEVELDKLVEIRGDWEVKVWELNEKLKLAKAGLLAAAAAVAKREKEIKEAERVYEVV